MPKLYRPDRSRRDDAIATPAPAPGALATVQAFLNTAAPDGKGDELARPEGVSRWLARQGLLAAGTELGEGDQRQAVAVREALRALLQAHSFGAELDDEVLWRLERELGRARFQLRLEPGGRVAFEPASRSFDDALGAVLAMVATAQMEGLWTHFKICGRKGCGRAFFDTSRAHNAKWCSRRCGERVRSEAYRRSDKFTKKK